MGNELQKLYQIINQQKSQADLFQQMEAQRQAEISKKSKEIMELKEEMEQMRTRLPQKGSN